MRAALLPALLLVPALAALLAGCRADDAPAGATPAATERPTIPFRVDGTLWFVRDRPGGGADTLARLAIEIADTDSTRTRGLMGRHVIPPETGMLFIFPMAAEQAFWMSNTPHALDIQYYGADSSLVSVAENARPYSTETLPSRGPAQFVVEVPAGATRRLGLVEGDRITWQRSGPGR